MPKTVPLVSVIVPVYNAVPYVREALDSVIEQTLPPRRIELIVIDDGSSDGSNTILKEFADQHAIIKLIEQPNSGTPGAARNSGLDRATGTYVFFLDADDKLTTEALRRLTNTAEEEGADMVLGKVAGIGGRRPPSSMFSKTVLDADLIEDKLFNTLAAWKLFRRSLIEDLELRFPTDLRIGEDHPFVARAYLNATKISVLADQDYYLLRRREDGLNITSGGETAPQAMRKTLALMEVVIQETSRGSKRDALARRPLGWSLTKALDKRFLALTAKEQDTLLGDLRFTIAPVYNDVMAKHLTPLNQIKVALALDSHTSEVLKVIEWEQANKGLPITATRQGFQYDLPPSTRDCLRHDLLAVSNPQPVTTLTKLAQGVSGIHLEVNASVKDSRDRAETATLALKRRGTEDTVNLSATSSKPLDLPKYRGLALSFDVRIDELDLGVWDFHVRQQFPNGTIDARLGRTRSRRIAPEGFWLDVNSIDRAQENAAYFTKDYGNLSLDIGGTLHTRSLSGRLVGVTSTPAGTPSALIALSSPDVSDVSFYLDATPSGFRAARQLLPHRMLSPGFYAVSLPTAHHTRTSTFTLSLESQGILTAVRLPEKLFPDSRSSMHFRLVDNERIQTERRASPAQRAVAVLRTTARGLPPPARRALLRLRDKLVGTSPN